MCGLLITETGAYPLAVHWIFDASEVHNSEWCVSWTLRLQGVILMFVFIIKNKLICGKNILTCLWEHARVRTGRVDWLDCPLNALWRLLPCFLGNQKSWCIFNTRFLLYGPAPANINTAYFKMRRPDTIDRRLCTANKYLQKYRSTKPQTNL